MAALNVLVQVQSITINPTANNVTTQIGLAPGDTSGLASFSMSFEQTSTTTPRYAIGATTTLAFP